VSEARDDDTRSYGLARLLALSDGVFAIAITLLVLSLQADVDVQAEGLNRALGDAWPGLLAYALSVAVIGAFWIGHHAFFATVRAVDRGLLWCNVVYLGLIALIPFPTDLLGRYGEQTGATVAYALTIALVALANFGTGEYARRRGLLAEATSPDLRTLPIAAVFLASIPVAFWSPDAAKYLWLLLIPAQRWPHPPSTPSPR
jgi:uncharacterized membrane protein